MKASTLYPTCLLRVALVLLSLICLTPANAQEEEEGEWNHGKELYIPRDLRKLNLNDSTSEWSYSRMALTPNFAIFWQKGFGNDLSCPPDLEGHPMKVDLKNLEDRLEQYYAYYREKLHWLKQGTLADKFRMMIMINYSLEGTAYGGDYDGVIGALWLAPNRLQDPRLNCIAHELGHSFQSQIMCDADGEAWGGGAFFEMTSQWMLWQVNPNWQTDEKYHLDAFKKLTHKPFLDGENIYHSPYVIEQWATKRGVDVVAELYRQGKRGEDPAMTYKRMFNLSQDAYLDELFDGCRHFVNWDFQRVWNETRPYACQWIQPDFTSETDAKGQPWERISKEQEPGEGGFNIVKLSVPENHKIAVHFEGLSNEKTAGWRYGLVAVDNAGQAHYSAASSKKTGMLKFNLPADTKQLFLVVMGAPTEHEPMTFGYGQEDKGSQTFPWRYTIK